MAEKKPPKVTRIYDTRFAQDRTHLPMTMEQFQALTNELLPELNKLTVPNALDADYVAQILVSALHSLPRDHAFVSKYALYEACVYRISSHMTHHILEEIQARLKAEKKPEDMTAVPAEPASDETIVKAVASAESSVH